MSTHIVTSSNMKFEGCFSQVDHRGGPVRRMHVCEGTGNRNAEMEKKSAVEEV